MFFTIKSNRHPNEIKYRVYFNARRAVLLYKKGINELELDNYLIKNYKTNLSLMCLKLLNNMNFSSNNNELVVTFKSQELDKIASLITYGNGKLQGSNILKIAFGIK